jgi:hypothetical protein
MCGRPPPGKMFFGDDDSVGQVQSCVRPLLAVHMTAGPDEVRGVCSHSGHRVLRRRLALGFDRSSVSTVSSSIP